MADSEGNQLKNALLTVTDSILGAAVLIILGTWAGSFLDDRLHTSPWLSISLALIGAGLGLARLVFKAVKLGEANKK